MMKSEVGKMELMQSGVGRVLRSVVLAVMMVGALHFSIVPSFAAESEIFENPLPTEYSEEDYKKISAYRENLENLYPTTVFDKEKLIELYSIASKLESDANYGKAGDLYFEMSDLKGLPEIFRDINLFRASFNYYLAGEVERATFCVEHVKNHRLVAEPNLQLFKTITMSTSSSGDAGFAEFSKKVDEFTTFYMELTKDEMISSGRTLAPPFPREAVPVD